MDILRTSEASKYLSISPWKLRKLVKEGENLVHKRGRQHQPSQVFGEGLGCLIGKCRVQANV